MLEHSLLFIIAAIRAGIDAGMNMIDTAEMYGNGGSERMVAQAIKPYNRKDLYIVSKVKPSHAIGAKLDKAIKGTLERLETKYVDLYLLHWNNGLDLAEVAKGMHELKEAGLIRDWGVSNLDIDEMQELYEVPYGNECITNQVLYHLGSRGIEYSLQPWMNEKDMITMAYCPLAQFGRLRQGLLMHPAVTAVAEKNNAHPAQVMLAWLMKKTNVIPIPRTSRIEHTLENAAAMKLKLSGSDMSLLDRAFPAPDHKVPLDIE